MPFKIRDCGFSHPDKKWLFSSRSFSLPLSRAEQWSCHGKPRQLNVSQAALIPAESLALMLFRCDIRAVSQESKSHRYSSFERSMFTKSGKISSLDDVKRCNLCWKFMMLASHKNQFYSTFNVRHIKMRNMVNAGGQKLWEIASTKKMDGNRKSLLW